MTKREIEELEELMGKLGRKLLSCIEVIEESLPLIYKLKREIERDEWQKGEREILY